VRIAPAATGHGIARAIGTHLITGDGDLDGDIGAAARFGRGAERPEFHLIELLHTPTVSTISQQVACPKQLKKGCASGRDSVAPCVAPSRP
jgi:hypothetical protein